METQRTGVGPVRVEGHQGATGQPQVTGGGGLGVLEAGPEHRPATAPPPWLCRDTTAFCLLSLKPSLPCKHPRNSQQLAHTSSICVMALVLGPGSAGRPGAPPSQPPKPASLPGAGEATRVRHRPDRGPRGCTKQRCLHGSADRGLIF